MIRMWTVVAVLMLAGCNGGIDTDDRGPYLWPTPDYGVPWTARQFSLRYNERSNTLEQLRALIAERCGPDFAFARVFPQRWTGPVLHPHTLRVVCGDAPPPRPEFRGQAVEAGSLLSLTRGGPGGDFFEGED
ncbi:MAG: hypothetical protein WCO00_14375 [Rhodospirillaceae bacterium]